MPAVQGPGDELAVHVVAIRALPALRRIEAREEVAVMGFKPRVKIALVKCGRCGRRYNNPLTHVCVVRFNPRAAKKIGKPKGKR